MNNKTRLALTVAVYLALSACGGGGGGGDNAGANQAPVSVPSPSTTPTFNATSSEGMWAGSTSTKRDMMGIVGADGTYWVLYSKIGDPSVIAGAVQGNAGSSNGVFSSTNGRDFNIEAQSITDVSVNATYTPRSRLDGTIAYYGTGSRVTFNSTYDLAYDKRASLQALAGDYSGSAAVVQASESARLTINASGGISGNSASGCAYTGQATPKAEGAAFTLTVTFAGGNCANGTDTVRGVGYLDPDTGVLYGAALNSGRSNGLIFSGKKSGFVPQPITNTPTIPSTTTIPNTGTNSNPTCYTGPRGGTYTITSGGNKNYSGC